MIRNIDIIYFDNVGLYNDWKIANKNTNIKELGLYYNGNGQLVCTIGTVC